MRRGYDESQIVAAHRKRTAVASALIFLAIPAVIALGVILFNGRNYMMVSLLILALTMLPFFMVFERRKPKAREIVLIAMMCALTVCAQLICGVTVPVRAGTAIIIACGTVSTTSLETLQKENDLPLWAWWNPPAAGHWL